MPAEKLPETFNSPRSAVVSEDASDWIRTFVKHLEIEFFAGISKHSSVNIAVFQEVTVQAMFATILESGLSKESLVEILGRSLLERKLGGGWTSDLNRRRFELIDLEIQGKITVAEQIELQGLTRMMRQHLDSDSGSSFEGALELHRRLMDMQ